MAAMYLTQALMLKNLQESAVILAFFFVFIALVDRREWLGFMTAKPLVMIGLSSYSLYLLHQNIGGAVLSSLPTGWPLWTYALAALSVLGGILLVARSVYLFVERPSQSLARRFDRRTSA